MNWLWGIGIVAVAAGLAWLGFRIEPHWVSKDARRFLCVGQFMNHLGMPTTGWRETKVIVTMDGAVVIDQKKFMKHHSSAWTLTGESPDPPKNRAVFLLRGTDEHGQKQMLALRMPAKSRAVEVVRDALPKVKEPGRGTG